MYKLFSEGIYFMEKITCRYSYYIYKLKTHIYIYILNILRRKVDSVTLRVASNVEVVMHLHAFVCSFVTSKSDTVP